jgi:hypothetical protein
MELIDLQILYSYACVYFSEISYSTFYGKEMSDIHR